MPRPARSHPPDPSPASQPRTAGSGPWRVLDGVERPGAFEACADRVVEHRVQGRLVRAHPGTDGRAAAALVLAARRVDIDAADDLARGGAEHGVGESTALREVLRVALEIAQVFRQAHLVRPVTPGESRGRLDVTDAGRPGGIVRGVVPGPERF